MFRKYSKWLCYFLIILLLPYVITIFINGPDKKVSGEAISIDEYCLGRLAKEIPADSEMEAIKAQAVLVRTSVYKQLAENGNTALAEDEIWTQEEMEQQWGIALYGKYYKRLQTAWDATEGQVLMYKEEIANAPFCKLTNGNSRDGKEVLGKEYPYLKIRECPLDVESVDQLETVVVDEVEMEILETDTAGYVTKIKVGDEIVSGEEFRNTYGLASSCFIIQKYDGKLRITTRGVGHGLGLSQYTAGEMAKAGDSYEKILQYFFEGTELREVTDIVNTGE